MKNEIIDINNKIRLHYLKEDKYKSNFISVFLTVPLERENVTMNALIPAVLRRGTKRLKTMKNLEIEMENMYGSTIDCGVDKSGNNHILKFYIESIKDEYVKENIFEKSIQNISELILDPLLVDGIINKEYVEQEKNTLKTIIEDKINDKLSYSTQRCIEEMYDNKSYGIYVYGYTEDLDKISCEDIYNQYKKVLSTAKIDIFVITNKEKDEVINYIDRYFVSDYLNDRHQVYEPKSSNIVNSHNEKNINEQMDVVQGKLIMGLNITNKDLDLYDVTIYNAILGVGCNSKIFKNVREREHLVYSAGSSYIPAANILLIKAGIEINKYDKALSVIKQQLDDIKNGRITQREFQDAKQVIIGSYKTLIDEQAKTINYYMNQEILSRNINIEDAIEKIQEVKLEDVINVSNYIDIDTIYFLKNI